eukprot:TRINITY_DN6215_c0_g1_i1.p1 TRINITY_DN6215_c0_g1~~TRINITY_DN6215_c0_g1_i1.p1  ORF type:complete len:154 (-),score=48.95 TRINITY_DN6215_c0_g1_i1:187-600(-)
MDTSDDSQSRKSSHSRFSADRSDSADTFGVMEFQQIPDDFCKWDEHTSGFGLKLLTRMGYTFGKGLGKEQKGMVDPIKVRQIPTNCSLDFLDTENLPATKPGEGKSAKRRKRKREKEAKRRKERKNILGRKEERQQK